MPTPPDSPEAPGSAAQVSSLAAGAALPPRLEHGSPHRRPIGTRRWFWVLCVGVGAAVAGVLLVGWTRSTTTPGAAGARTTVGSPASSSTTAPARASTTTAAVPPTRQRTAQAAADFLIGAWAGANRTQAATGATADAVHALFAVPYPSGEADNRGCSDGAPPIACSYGPPGGGDPNAAIFIVQVSQASDGGWYASSVRIEG